MNKGAAMFIKSAYIDSNFGSAIQAFIDNGGVVNFESCRIEKFNFDVRKSRESVFLNCTFENCELYLAAMGQANGCIFMHPPKLQEQ